MNIDFEALIKSLTSRANAIFSDSDKIVDLLARTKTKLEENKELKSLFDDVRIIVELIKDYTNGAYKELSKNSIILVIISLIYLVNPFDLIPDMLFGGFIDDAAVIAYILKRISTELEIYKEWKVNHEDNPEIIDDDEDEDFDDDDMIEITLDDK